MMDELQYRARAVLLDDGTVHSGGGVRVKDGRVVEVLSRVARNAQDLGDVWITPPFVNAHCHLELTGFAGQLPRDRGFGTWVQTLMGLRSAADSEELETAARLGARRLLATGCAEVHDIDTTGAAARALIDERLRSTVYREAIDAGDPVRRSQRLAELEAPLFTREGMLEGISPHAPFTCSLELLSGIADLARRRRLPLSMHWAETREERQYLLDGSGPLADLLPPSPRCSGLDLIAAAGLLSADIQLSLVHGNHPEPGDYERLAAAGVTLVHCPGTHAFFDREPFDSEAAIRAGVRLQLGTDSLASNDDLDMSAELRRFLPLPGVTLDLAWKASTGGAGLIGCTHLALWHAEGVDSDLDSIIASGLSPRTLELPHDAGHATGDPSRYPVGS